MPKSRVVASKVSINLVLHGTIKEFTKIRITNLHSHKHEWRLLIITLIHIFLKTKKVNVFSYAYCPLDFLNKVALYFVTNWNEQSKNSEVCELISRSVLGDKSLFCLFFTLWYWLYLSLFTITSLMLSKGLFLNSLLSFFLILLSRSLLVWFI